MLAAILPCTLIKKQLRDGINSLLFLNSIVSLIWACLYFETFPFVPCCACMPNWMGITLSLEFPANFSHVTIVTVSRTSGKLKYAERMNSNKLYMRQLKWYSQSGWEISSWNLMGEHIIHNIRGYGEKFSAKPTTDEKLGTRPLVKDPDRSYYHRHTSWKFFL